MNIYYLIFVIIVTLSIVSSGLVTITFGQEEKLQTYESLDIGIRFLYPSYWGNIVQEGCHEGQPCVLNILSSPFKGNLVINKVSKETCMCNTLIEFVKMWYNISKENENFSFINDNQTIVGKKYPAWQFEYSSLYPSTNQSVRNQYVLTTNNDVFYSFAVVFPNDTGVKRFPEFRKLIDSVEFLPKKVTKLPSFMSMNETKQPESANNTEDKPQGIQILSHNSFTDSIGYLHVVGEIKNNSPSAANFVKIVGTFYDVNNQVVATDFTYANPSEIGSGEKAPFEILLLSASVPISQIDHYELQATYD